MGPARMSHPGDWSKDISDSADPKAGIVLACANKKRNWEQVRNKVEDGRGQVVQGNSHDNNICELF